MKDVRAALRRAGEGRRKVQADDADGAIGLRRHIDRHAEQPGEDGLV